MALYEKKCKCCGAMCSELEYGHFVIMDHEAGEEDKERRIVLTDKGTSSCSERRKFEDTIFCTEPRT